MSEGKLALKMQRVVSSAYQDSRGEWHLTADDHHVRKLLKKAIKALSTNPPHLDRGTADT